MRHGDVSADSSPKLPGQDAFGAMQEIVAILEADPATTGARSISMGCASTLHAKAEEHRAAGGLDMLVTGEGHDSSRC